jgi:ribonucleotide reductase alpha subunit
MVMALFHAAITSIEYDRWRIHLNEWRNKIANDIEYQKKIKIKNTINEVNIFAENQEVNIPFFECYVEEEGRISEIDYAYAVWDGELGKWIEEMYELVENEKYCLNTPISINFIDSWGNIEIVCEIQEQGEFEEDNCCCKNCGD